MNVPNHRAIIFATIHDLSIPHHLAAPITSAAQSSQDRLIIILVSPLFDDPNVGHDTKHIRCWKEVQSLLTFLYVQATNVAQQQDKVLMEVDVLLKGVHEALPHDIADGMDTLFRLHCG